MITGMGRDTQTFSACLRVSAFLTESALNANGKKATKTSCGACACWKKQVHRTFSVQMRSSRLNSHKRRHTDCVFCFLPSEGC